MNMSFCCVDCAVFGRFGGMTAFGPFGSAFEWHGSLPRLIGIYVYLLNLKDDICAEYFQNVHANSPLHRRII